MTLKKIAKKADMHITQMIFMLIGLTVFFSIVLLFFLSFSISNVQKSVEQSSKVGAVLLAEGLAGSPEFRCPSDLAIGTGICIDSDKILALITNNRAYASFWSNDISGLRIEKVNSGINESIICDSGSYDRCTSFIIIPNKPGEIEEYASYATLCRVESKNGKYPYCELAKVIVAAEKRTL